MTEDALRARIKDLAEWARYMADGYARDQAQESARHPYAPCEYDAGAAMAYKRMEEKLLELLKGGSNEQP